MPNVQPPPNAPEVGLPVHAEIADAGRGPRPNVVLICLDQCRGDWLGAAGHGVVRTPQLDKLAQQGLRFARAMSESPVCVPARRILMTGRSPWGVAMHQNRDTQPFPEGPKLAELFRAAGYQTHAVGKLHTWPPRNRLGFDDVQLNEEGRTAGLPQGDDYESFVRGLGLGPLIASHGLGNNQYDYRPSPLPEHATTTGWTADQAMRFLQRRDPTRPFLLHVSFDKPHPPLTPPAPYFDLYRDRAFPVPMLGEWLRAGVPTRLRAQRAQFQYDALLRRPDELQDSLRAYAALITHIDSRIGQLLGALREHELRASTWIVVVADHGDQLFEHGAFAKGDFLTGSCHVPFIVVPPAGAAPDRRRLGRAPTAPVGLADVLPTLCAAAGIAAPDGVEGRSLLPFLAADAPPWRDELIGRCGSSFGVQDARFRLHWLADDDRWLLHDLDHDPLCCRDLSGEPAHAATLARLREALRRRLVAAADEHVADGRLVARPVDRALDTAHTANPWNNRGWR